MCIGRGGSKVQVPMEINLCTYQKKKEMIDRAQRVVDSLKD